MLQVHVRDALSITKVQRFAFALIEHSGNNFVTRVLKEVSDLIFVGAEPMFTGDFSNRPSMSVTDLKKFLEVLCSLRSPLHRQKIDDLNKQERLTATRFAHRLDELPQARNKPVVTDPQQRSARNITHARRFDHQHRRAAFREPLVPIEILLRDKAVFSGAPGHHRGHPGAAERFASTDSNWRVKKRSRGFFGGWPVGFFDPVADWVRKLPHVRASTVPRYAD